MRRLLPLALILLTACAHGPHRAPASAPAYAWVTFDAAGIGTSGTAGAADRRTGRPLTIDDPVRVASVSKLVVALGVMRLVEAGRIDLDEDVSEKLGWRLRNPAFPDVPVTLRLLLSHRSSLTDDVDYAIPLGRTVQASLADPKAFDASHPPGSFFRYANLNFPVIATVLERATGERFDRLMERLVLAPMRIDACFNWTTCSDAAVARAVVLYQPDGTAIRDDLAGTRPICPVVPAADSGCDLAAYRPGTNGALFSPQGGLRISARGLATVGRLLAGHGTLDGERFLRPESIATLLGPAWRHDGRNGATEDGFYCSYGLATQTVPTPVSGCHDALFGRRTMVGHAGDAYGVRSGLWIDPASGAGIAYFASGNGDDPPRGRTAFRAVEERLARHLAR
jgi:CubicO group peptidase (beta-lactamase class C family)